MDKAEETLSKPVLEFAKIMQYKLNKNKFKPSEMMIIGSEGRTWHQCSTEWLLIRIYDELVELNDAINEGKSNDEIQKECADVANFAMMIFDNLSYKSNQEESNAKNKTRKGRNLILMRRT